MYDQYILSLGSFSELTASPCVEVVIVVCPFISFILSFVILLSFCQSIRLIAEYTNAAVLKISKSARTQFFFFNFLTFLTLVIS